MGDKDKDLAKAIIENDDYRDFIERHLINLSEPLPTDLMNLPDNDAGEFIKTDIRANKKIVTRWNRVKSMARPKVAGSSNTVPE